MGPTRMRLSKPVLASVQGHAVAGGLELAAWCDLRICDTTAVFGVFCRRWGVPLIDGGTVRLPRLIGHSRAMDLVLTGRPVEADEALAIGLANRVVEAGTARAAAETLAAQLAQFPQECMVADRQSVYAQWDAAAAGGIGDDCDYAANNATAEWEAAAIYNEWATGHPVLLRESVKGAARFRDGEGRGGSGV